MRDRIKRIVGESGMGDRFLRRTFSTFQLTDEEIAARNVIPTTNPAGEPHRIIADEYFSENDTFTQWVPTDPDQPGPAASEQLKPTVLSEAQKISDRIGNKTKVTDPDYWGLASVMTEEEAQLTSCMKVRVPMTLAQVVCASGMSAEHVQELLDTLSIKGIIEYNNDEIVSSDLRGDYNTSIFDEKAGIMLNDHFVKLVSWYDNENSYTSQMVRTIKHFGKLLNA